MTKALGEEMRFPSSVLGPRERAPFFLEATAALFNTFNSHLELSLRPECSRDGKGSRGKWLVLRWELGVNGEEGYQSSVFSCQ